MDSVDVTEGGLDMVLQRFSISTDHPLLDSRVVRIKLKSPIVSNGRIVDVIVIEQGSEYFSTPDLVVQGTGQFSKLVPITNGGQIVSVHIENSGIGYVPDETTIDVIPVGRNEIEALNSTSGTSILSTEDQKHHSYLMMDLLLNRMITTHFNTLPHTPQDHSERVLTL